MPSFFVVSKLLMLKLLLTSIFGIHTYDFGYHPSAEEFDSLMRETRKTWTHDLIANEHRRSWNAPSSSRNEARHFVPKYNYESARNRYPTVMTTDRPWPGYAPQTLAKPEHNRHDQQGAASSVIVNTNIGSSLDFTMFSDESSDVHINPSQFVGDSDYQNIAKPYGTSIKPRPIAVPNSIKIPNYTVSESVELPSYQQRPSSIIAINPTSSVSNSLSVSQNKYSPNNVYKNTSETHLPIFFTNPVTGIVYAITEVGKLPYNKTQSNDSIPIYITKEQYDRDLFLLRKHYENGCQLASNKLQNKPIPSTSSAISVSSNTTVRPQIIRLQKPLNTISKLPIAKLPSSLHKPPPVMVQSEVTVSDHVNLPPKRKKKPKIKKKKNRNKRPGKKSSVVVNVTGRPVISGTVPKIVIGTRTSTVQPSVSTNKLSTQLEKPSVSTTIFSNRPLAATSGYMFSKLSTSEVRKPEPSNPYPSHRIVRRSVTNIRDVIDQTQDIATTKDFSSAHKDLDISWKPFKSTIITDKPTVKTARSKSPTKRKNPPKNRNLTMTNRVRISKRNQTNTLLFASRRRSNSTSKPLNMSSTIHPKVDFLEHNTTVEGPDSRRRSYTTTKPSNMSSTIHTKVDFLENNTTIKRPANSTPRSSRKDSKDKEKKKKNRKDVRPDFDLFDLGDNYDDDDDDDDDDDSYDESYYDDDKKAKRPTKKKKNTSDSSTDNQDNISIDSIEDLKEDITTDNSSSAEEGADYGAMVEEPENDYHTDNDATEENTISTTKNTSGKKRIRRRPQNAITTSYEDYDNTEDDDDSGMAAFFRMLFYPVQLVMNRLFDSNNSEESDKPKYPTYTLYNNNVKQLESEEDDEPSSSLSSWLSSWFGYNRRTKKIGSTTAAPPPLPAPAPSEEPGWLESWLGYAKTTTEASAEDYDDYDKWFFGWFDTKPKARRRRTTTTTTTPLPQVPILTIVDPMRNPQNWIGILASHFNATAQSATTHNPLIQAITRATTLATTENPDIPLRISYDKYQIWRLKPQDDTQLKSLEEYKKSEDGMRLQWLKGPSLRGLTDVLVSPKMLIDFRGSLNFETIAYEVLIFDVGKAIAYEASKEQYYRTTQRPLKQRKRPSLTTASTMSWDKYHEYDDIIKYLESMRIRHPQIVELIHIGRSYEGRPLVIAKIELKQAATTTGSGSSASSGNHKKLKYKKKLGQASAVFLESGTHGMEWIGPATTTWIISELLRIMKSNHTAVEYEFIKNTTWYIMPVLNPDGYVYSHEYDRFWKKSRSRHTTSPSLINSAMTWLQQKKTPKKVCYGVDMDRNWHYQWGKRGSSKSACNELFAGPVPFSEPETKALSEFLMDYRRQIKLYISLQAYGQIISYPSKANDSFNSERMDDFFDVAMVGTDSLRKKGNKSRYKIDSSNDLTENRAGCADAFAAYEVGIPFSYTMQLADNGVHGYLLPSSSIEQTARDAFEIITTMLDYI